MRNIYLAYKTIHKVQVKSNAILVYYDLCRRANKEDECWPSKQTIAKACHISVSTVTRSLRELEKAGMLVTVNRHCENNRQTSNCYKIFDTPQQFTQFPEEPKESEPINTPEQQLVLDIPQQESPAAFTQEVTPQIEYTKAPPQSPVSVLISDTSNYTGKAQTGLDSRSPSTKCTSCVKSKDLRANSPFQLLLCFFQAKYDTLAHVSVTPLGTIPEKKATVNLRKESIISKVAMWYKERHTENRAGLGYDLAKNE